MQQEIGNVKKKKAKQREAVANFKLPAITEKKNTLGKNQKNKNFYPV